MDTERVPLAVIGGGTMGAAIIEGGLTAGVLAAGAVFVAEPDAGKHPGLGSLGASVRSSTREVMELLPPRGQVLLAVKPQQLQAAAAELARMLRGRVVISILAGTPIAKLSAALGGHSKIVRVMPNTPARVRRGMTAVSIGPDAREEDAAFCTELFEAVGTVVRIDESLMDAFTAVAASGSAYVFYLAEAMVRSAVELGFEESVAIRVVRETIAGSGALLAWTGQTPRELINGVQSKGGTTEAALRVLDDRRVQDAVVQAIAAARDRGRELSGLP